MASIMLQNVLDKKQQKKEIKRKYRLKVKEAYKRQRIDPSSSSSSSSSSENSEDETKAPSPSPIIVEQPIENNTFENKSDEEAEEDEKDNEDEKRKEEEKNKFNIIFERIDKLTKEMEEMKKRVGFATTQPRLPSASKPKKSEEDFKNKSSFAGLKDFWMPELRQYFEQILTMLEKLQKQIDQSRQ